MSDPGRDDFYVGYQSHAPRTVARFVRGWIALLLALGVVMAVALVLLQRPFDPGVFEYGETRSFEGTLVMDPHPALLVARPGRSGALEPFSRFGLVAFGKHGADQLVETFLGRSVRLRGTLVYREGQTLIEVAAGSLEPAGAVRAAAPEGSRGRRLGSVSLVGEIVDSKCYLGVMKPGRWKPHRACAVRCLSGGIPALFVVEDDTGERRHYRLTDREGDPVNQRILDRVAEPIRISGELVEQGGHLVLVADPESYERVAGEARE